MNFKKSTVWACQIAEVVYPLDTNEECDRARDALRAAGLERTGRMLHRDGELLTIGNVPDLQANERAERATY